MGEDLAEALLFLQAEQFDPLGEWKVLRDYLDGSDIRFRRIPVDKFFTGVEAAQQADPVAIADLTHSFAVCIGGLFRSSYVNELLKELGIEAIKAGSGEGYVLMDFWEKISKGGAEISEEGYLVFPGADRPILTLLLGLEAEYDTDLLVPLIRSFKVLEERMPGKKLKLDVMILDGSEDEFQRQRDIFWESRGRK